MASLTPESFAATQITEGSPEIGGTDVSTKRPIIQRDTFLGEFPYVRFGSGRENLVILPGITLENEPPNRLAAWTPPRLRALRQGLHGLCDQPQARHAARIYHAGHGTGLRAGDRG